MRRPCLFLVLLVLGVPITTFAQVPPDKVLSTFQVVDGLELSLWASEPMFVNPTCMDIDHLGRVWVCESVNYRHKLHGQPPRRPEGDRIVILEDTKGTGQADKATTFYQSPDILAPMGIAVAKDPEGPSYKVFVCQSPDILVFEDKDGDGKADGPPKKLLTGFQGIDHDHGVHGILIGPDMKLYFSVGDQGVKDLQSSDGKGRKWTTNHTDCQGGTIWRCDLDGKNLELIAHNFRNEYEPCVDSFGTVFVSDNDDDGNEQTRICYVMPGGNYGYWPRGPGQSHWHEEQPGVVPKILRTYFGSPTGMCVYEGTLLPKKYWGQLLHTDAGPRHVRCYHVEPDGAGYKVDREDMVTSTDTWFRPSDICVAPDGSVFVADWYDPGVGGHGMGDWTRGRIYRLAPKGNKPNVPKVDLTTKEGILAALGSPALSVRYMAMSKLRALEPSHAVEILKPATSQTEQPILRARSLWQIAAIAQADLSKGTDLLPGFEAAGAGEEPFRLLHIRAVHDLAARSSGVDVAGRMLYWLRNKSPEVRREILLAVREAEPAKARPLILELARQYDGKDRFYLEAIGIAVGRCDQARREAILAEFDKEFPEWDDKVADLVWELRPPAMMPRLEKLLADAKLTVAQRGRIVDILATSDDGAAGALLLCQLTTGPADEVRDRALKNLVAFLPGKWASLKKAPELRAAVDKLLAERESQTQAFDLIAAAEAEDYLPVLVRLANEGGTLAATRSAAVRALAAIKTQPSVDALEKMIAVDALRADAIASLGRMRTELSVVPLKKVVLDEKQPADVRIEAVAALAASRPGTQWLLSERAANTLPEALVADAGRLLRNSPYQDLRNKAQIAFPAPGKIDPKKLPNITTLAARRGDANHGRQILAASVKSELQCLKCHTVRGVGGQIGPDLSMIGKKASRDNLFESILYPSKAIADQYVTWTVETGKGLNVSGLIVEETPDLLTLRDANGKDTRIPVKEIESRVKSVTSLMPDNLLAFMTEDELVDLVEYLFTLKTPVLAFDYWHIIGPFDNGENDAGLDRVFPPEKGIDLKATYDGKTGKVGWRTVKPDAQSYIDLAAFYAGHSTNTVSYLSREVESPTDQDAVVLLGADDGCKLWVNDQQVFTDRQHAAAEPAKFSVPVKLRKGPNKIVLKINNGNDPHGFFLSIEAVQELKRLESK
jgi:putative membrane-bound dehydrogenase-like protein